MRLNEADTEIRNGGLHTALLGFPETGPDTEVNVLVVRRVGKTSHHHDPRLRGDIIITTPLRRE